MNKRIAIPVIGVLAVGFIVTGVFYLQGTGKLGDAQDEIAGLHGDVSGLEGDLAATETDLAATEADLAATETDLAATETDLAATETDLAATETDLAATETDLAEAEDLVSDLETEIDQANSATQIQLDRNLTLSEELLTVKDPRHFESLEELEAWLAQDDTDTRVRWQSLPPAERTFILQVRALRDGYLLPAWFEDFNLLDGIMEDHIDDNHFDGLVDYVGNLAYIGEEIYYVWAGDDSVLPFTFMMPLIPSHPLPEE